MPILSFSLLSRPPTQQRWRQMGVWRRCGSCNLGGSSLIGEPTETSSYRLY